MPGKHLCNNCSQFFTLKALVKHMNECVVNVAEEQQTVVPDKRRKVEEAIEHSIEGLLDNSSSFDLEGCEVEKVIAEKMALALPLKTFDTSTSFQTMTTASSSWTERTRSSMKSCRSTTSSIKLQLHLFNGTTNIALVNHVQISYLEVI